MSRARVVVGSIALCLGACDQVWGLDRNDVLPTCGAGTALIVDDFSGSNTCLPWGDAFEHPGSTASQENGALQVVVHTKGAAGCTSKNPVDFTAHTLFARVSDVIPTAGAYTSMNANQTESITEVNGNLYYQDANGGAYEHLGYEPGAMRWWRLDAHGGIVTASYSADATTWLELGHRTQTPTVPDNIALLAGLAMDEDTVGASTFDYVLLCN